MFIEHVTPSFYPTIGGVQSYILELSKQLQAKGHTSIVHTSNVGSDGSILASTDVIDGIKVYRYKPIFKLGYYKTLFRPNLLWDSDSIVHLHGYGFLTNDSVAKKTENAIVYSLHHGLNSSDRMTLQRFLYDRLLGYPTLRRSSAVFTNNRLDAYTSSWIAPTYLVPPGLPDEAFVRPNEQEVSKLRQAFGKYVLYVGRLAYDKNVDFLIDAVRSIPDVHLVIAGPDAGARNLLESISDPCQVTFTGKVDEPTKRNLIAGSEMLVLPSQYESTGTVILEAFAQGIPVVASNVGGIPDIVEDGITGLLTDPNNTYSLRRDIELQLAINKRGDEDAVFGVEYRKFIAEDYRWSHIADTVISIYKDIV